MGPLPVGMVEWCANAVDDDGDGAVDCADPDCALEAFEFGGVVDSQGGSYTLEVADLDGDGDDDLALARAVLDQGAIFAYTNDGAGGFVRRRVGDTDYIGTLAAVDLDLDGRLDLVEGTRGREYAWDSTLYGFQQAPDGSFVRHHLRTLHGHSYLSIASAALDVDAIPDLVAVTSTGVSLYPGRPGFALGASVDLFSTAYSVVRLPDLEGDGDVDVVVGGANVRWIENHDGNFGPDALVAAHEVGALVTGDLDDDGDLDLVFGSWSPDSVGWIENLGGRFAPSVSLDATATYAVQVLDADHDGRLDVVNLTGSLSDEVVLRRNLGAGTFAAPRRTRVECDGALLLDDDRLLVADVDGGALDLVCVAQQSATMVLTWYRGLECLGEDADGDGLSNADEQDRSGTDPFDPDDPVQAPHHTGDSGEPQTGSAAHTADTGLRDTGTPPPPVPEPTGCGCADTGTTPAGGWAAALAVVLVLVRAVGGPRGRVA